MIDLHFHLLPGIDDGPATDDDMLALARAAVTAGTKTVVATPHVSWEYRNTAAGISDVLARTRARLQSEGIQLEVVAGAEIAATLAVELPDDELRSLSLGGAGWLLIECPHTPTATGFDAALFQLQGRGHRIMLAHPERCAGLRRDPDLLERLVRSGMGTSITASSLTGRFGSDPQHLAIRMLKAGLVQNVASDAHDRRRPPEIRAHLERVGLGEVMESFVRTVPERVLAGESLGPPPTAILGRARPRWLAFLRGDGSRKT